MPELPIRVMIVDDSLTARTAFGKIIGQADDLSIVSEASSAEAAIGKLRLMAIDVILLDLEMPGMGGLKALPHLLAINPKTQVLVVSSLTQDGAEHSLAALAMGAADTMLKPAAGGLDAIYRRNLLDRIRALGSNQRNQAAKRPPRLVPVKNNKPSHAIAIGASTGGIHALVAFFQALPAEFPLPMLITQHLPANFMEVFARQMQTASGRKTRMAEEGLPLREREILIAPGQSSLVVRKAGQGLVAGLSNAPSISGCSPSVDPMFETLADATDGHATGIVLSGMGRDGAFGAQTLFNAGGTLLAQDAHSSAVWGMPRAVADAGLASAVLPPDKLAQFVAARTGIPSWR